MNYLNNALFSKKIDEFKVTLQMLFQQISFLGILMLLFLLFNPNSLTAQNTTPCQTVEVIGSTENIIIDGGNSPIKIIKIYNSNWERVEECSGDCGFPFSFATAAGDYFVQIQFYDANWGWICQTENLQIEVAENSGNCEFIDANGVCEGDFHLSTQAEVDAFCDCKIVEGDLFIGTEVSFTITDITSLNSLNKLTQVNGNLFIDRNPITSLDGLNSLETVTQTFSINDNDNLNDISSLTNIESVNRLLVASNDVLISLNGINNLKTLHNLVIADNSKLQDIKVFQEITTLTNLRITNNDNLTNLDGLNQLKKIGNTSNPTPSLTIDRNAKLTNLDALLIVQEIINGMAIIDNVSLNNCCGIAHLIDNNPSNGVVIPSDIIAVRDNSPGCNSVEEILENCQTPIPNCDQISLSQNPNNAGTIDIAGLNTPHYIVKVYDADWNRLLSCTDDCNFVGAYPPGLYRIHAQLYTEDWQYICETDFLEIELGGNPCGAICSQEVIELKTQAEVDAFCDCETILGDLRIGQPSTLSDITSLENLKTIKRINGVLFISNTAITDLKGLENLEFVGSSLVLLKNPSLVSLRGLDNLETITNNLLISQNESLKSLNGLNTLNNLTSLTITTNNQLVNIQSLYRIKELNLVQITANQNLTYLDGLNQLEVLKGGVESFSASLIIGGNASLKNLNALVNLKTVEKDIIIRVNNALEDCCGISHLVDNDPNNGIATGNFTIEDNLSGCNSVQEILDNCQNNTIDCNAISANYQFGIQDTYEGLGVEGLDAPIDIVKIYDANWNRVFECFGDCDNPTVITDLPPNLYRIHAQQYDENWKQICETDFLEVTIPENNGSLDRNVKDKIDFTFFPNPVRTTLTVNTTTLKGKKGNIQIYNILGHSVAQIPNKMFDQNFETINLEHLENGIYYLNIQSNGFRAIGKPFIFEHLK